MSVASNITAFVASLATAINARNAPGPSDYQMWLAQGNVGTLADYRTSLVGPDEDFASFFTNQLGAVPASGAASETQAGVTQFATSAEALAGTLGTKGLSALRHSGVHVASSLVDLNAKAGALPPGSLIALADHTFSTNNILYRSLWFIAYGRATPAAPLQASTLSALGSLFGAIGQGNNPSYPNLALEPFVSEGIVYRNFGSDSTRDLYRYVGVATGWLMWAGRAVINNFASNVGTRDGNTAYVNEERVFAEDVFIDMMVSGPNAAGAGTILASVPNAPPIDQFISCSYIDSVTVNQSPQWRPGSVYVASDQGVRTLAHNMNASWALGFSGRYRRKIPTV